MEEILKSIDNTLKNINNRLAEISANIALQGKNSDGTPMTDEQKADIILRNSLRKIETVESLTVSPEDSIQVPEWEDDNE